MPRDGSGIYTTPAGTTAVPDTTIESAKYNANVADVAADLKAARPIVAGGTGGNSVTTARSNLQAERSGQQVTNFDTHVFENGSFWATSTATNAPAGLDVFGTAILHGDPNYVTLHARAILDATNRTFVRYKKGGTWDATWTVAANTEADYVNATGDTMTGDLTISKATPILTLNKIAAGQANVIQGSGALSARWWVRPGNDEAEAGSNAGSNFDILRFSDTGAFMGGVMSISRASGNVVFNNTITVSGAATISSGGLTVNPLVVINHTSSPSLHFDTDGVTRINISHDRTGPYSYYDFSNTLIFRDIAAGYPTRLTIDGSGNLALGASLSAMNGNVDARGLTCRSPAAGGGSYLYFFNNVGAAKGFLRWEDTLNQLELLSVDSGYKGIGFGVDGRVTVGTAMKCRAGTAGGLPGYAFNLNWTTAQLDCWIDATNIGYLAHTSDYRIKKDVVDLPSSWEAVKALRPIKYTQANFTAPAEIEARAKEALRIKLLNEEKEAKGEDQIETQPATSGHTFVADNVERWGFIAHELQATLIESAATGVKDSPDMVQAPNQWTVIAALTKALQEAMARIEALEAAAAVPAR